MRRSRHAPTATSLPASPEDEARGRTMRYAMLMSIRVICFVLMVLITPYGWYTWVLAAGAVVLPYFAVVVANVAAPTRSTTVENPERALSASAESPLEPESMRPEAVIQIRETGGDSASAK